MIRDKFPSMEDFFMDKIRVGIHAAHADIIFGKYFIYILTPQYYVYPCVIYNHLVSPNIYSREGKPLIHICGCKKIWDYCNSSLSTLKVRIPDSNSFNFDVGYLRNTSKIFYDVELPFCPDCILIYKSLFGESNISFDDFNIWNRLFLSKKILQLEKQTIYGFLSRDSRYSATSIEIGDKYFIAGRKDIV